MVFKETTAGKKFALADAQELVGRSMRYDSEITLEKGAKKANAKSLMSVVGLAIEKGEAVTVIANGDDQEEALGAVIKILQA